LKNPKYCSEKELVVRQMNWADILDRVAKESISEQGIF
jgi:hypothetical protein